MKTNKMSDLSNIFLAISALSVMCMFLSRSLSPLPTATLFFFLSWLASLFARGTRRPMIATFQRCKPATPIKKSTGKKISIIE